MTAEVGGYDGPVIDAFLHSPWLGGEEIGDPRGDRVDWQGDPRLRRVMATFNHVDSGSGVPLGGMAIGDLLVEMDAAGVEKAILPAKVYYRAESQSVRALHRELANLVASSSGRLRAIGTIVPPELGPGAYWDVMENVRLVQEAHEKHGFIGVHFTPSPWGMPPNHKWFYPVYAKCVELEMAVFVHVGMPGPLWPMEHQDPRYLDEVALAFPDLTIVAHHIGDPWTDISVRLAARHPNFYICTSAWSPKLYPPVLLEFMAGRWHGTLGCDKVIFASDYPLLEMSRAVADARRLALSGDQLERILYKNARRVFWAL